MAIENGYVTLPEFRRYVNETAGVTGSDDDFEEAIESASRAIDDHCGRRFYADDTATARRFRPLNAHKVYVDDFYTTTDLAVAVDLSGDGSFSTSLTIANLEPGPENAEAHGVPYTEIVVAEGTEFSYLAHRPAVQVTAKWGWANVPKPVYRACLIVGLDHYRLRDAPFGAVGMGEFAIRVRDNPAAVSLLGRYTKVQVA